MNTKFSKLGLPILTVGFIFSGFGPLRAETNWIVRPVIEPETSQVSCVGIYQDYSHQLMADKLILFIPGEFDRVQIQLGTEPEPEFLILNASEQPSFAVSIEGEIFEQLLISNQLIVKPMKEKEILGEYVINLIGINEAVHFLRTETCASGHAYQFPSDYFLMEEAPQAAPMVVPNWDEPKPRHRPRMSFPQPSKDGLPGSTSGGGSRFNEEPDDTEEPF